jgi:hypothetical protein
VLTNKVDIFYSKETYVHTIHVYYVRISNTLIAGCPILLQELWHVTQPMSSLCKPSTNKYVYQVFSSSHYSE